MHRHRLRDLRRGVKDRVLFRPGKRDLLRALDSSIGATKPGRPALLNNSYEFTLRNQGFSGHPGALVYVPSSFDKSSSSIEVVDACKIVGKKLDC